MNALYIETATEKSAIALFKGGKWNYRRLSSGPSLSKNLAQEIDLLLKEGCIRPEKVLIGKGPGSLTGVRVGKALGKALAFGWGIPCQEFCSMQALAPEEGPFGVLVDVRSGGIYLLTDQGVPELLSPEETLNAVERIPSLYSPHPEMIKKRIGILCQESVCSFGRLDENDSHRV